MQKKKGSSIRESRPIIALSLAVQSFAFFIMFIILCVKKKSIAAAFLAVSAMEGATAGYLLWQLSEETSAGLDAIGENLSDDSELDFDVTAIGNREDDEDPAVTTAVPLEEEVSEQEFQ